MSKANQAMVEKYHNDFLKEVEANAKEAGLDGNIVRATRLEEIAAKK